MSHERTWQFAMNQAFASLSGLARMDWFLWTLKQLLTGALSFTDANGDAIAAGSVQGTWTVVGSSDGVTGALDGVDRWGSTFDSGKLVWVSGFSGARSWMLLKSPAALGPMYLCLACDLIDSSSPDGSKVRILVGKTAPTTGSATSDPNNLSDYAVTVTGLSNTVSWLFVGSSAYASGSCAQAMLSTDGDFILFSGSSGSGVFETCLRAHLLAESQTGDSFPAAFQASYKQGGSPLEDALWSSAGAGNYFSAWECIALNSSGVALAYPLSLGNYKMGSGGSLAEALGSTGDGVGGTYDDWACYVYDTVKRSMKGRIADVRWTHQKPTDNTVYPLSGLVTDMIVGSSWVPANGGAIL